MYNDYRLQKPVEIEINVESYTMECGGCPMIFDFKDEDGTNYYFRLRWGCARIYCEDTNEILTNGNMDGFDGVCGWDDAVRWARMNGIKLNY
jgi:hypothetical protein